jgi:hypothetical protein
VSIGKIEGNNARVSKWRMGTGLAESPIQIRALSLNRNDPVDHRLHGRPARVTTRLRFFGERIRDQPVKRFPGPVPADAHLGGG